MSVILKFASLRPPPDDDPPLTLTSGSGFQADLAGTDLAGASEAARRFAAADFLADADQVARGEQLVALVERLRAEPSPTESQVVDEVNEAYGDPALQQGLPADFARARDSVVARYLLPDGPSAEDALTLVRAYTITEHALNATVDVADLPAVLDGPVALPDAVLALRSTASSPPPSDAPSAGELADRINAVAQLRRQVGVALQEIALHAEDELDLSELGQVKPLAAAYRDGGDPAAAPGPAKPPPVDPVGTSPLLRASARHNVVLSATAQQLMSAPAATALRTLQLDAAATPVSELRRRLTDEHAITGLQLRDLSGAFARLDPSDKVDAIRHLDPSWILQPVDAPDPRPPLAGAAPTSHTPIAPLGTADLMLVRAHVSHYERADIASIENVLTAEKLTHTGRALDRTESTTTADRETTDLRTLAQSTAEQDNDHTTVQAVGPTLGPVAAQSPGSFAQQVTDQVSSNSNLTERTRQLSVLTRLHETEDTYEHVLDNAAGKTSRPGVYQWLDKIYEAQVFNYGSRMLYDLVVPEPAALLWQSLDRTRGGLPLPVRPAPFTVPPSDLTAENWEYYAAGHGADGVSAPPAGEIVVTEAFGGRAASGFPGTPADGTFITAEARSTRIPPGYRAVSFRARVGASGWNGGFVRVTIGQKGFRIDNANGGYIPAGALAGETGQVPTTFHVDCDGVNLGVGSVVVGLEIICEPTDETVANWQVQTHGQILDANRARFQAYEQAVATRDANARVLLQGLSVARRTALIATELKRVTLELLTGQSFAGFNATAADAAGFPYPDAKATAALSTYIRFFEQAFEWDRLAYAFFPYFWGAQPSWPQKVLGAEPDDSFAAFLGAGAARVVLAVRPGYETPVETFLNTGVLPTGKDLLAVGRPLWVSLVDQLRGTQDTETAVGKPWTFSLATDLTLARPDTSIPRWTRDAGTGHWSDQPDPAF